MKLFSMVVSTGQKKRWLIIQCTDKLVLGLKSNNCIAVYSQKNTVSV